jgi:hypothetical protein
MQNQNLPNVPHFDPNSATTRAPNLNNLIQQATQVIRPTPVQVVKSSGIEQKFLTEAVLNLNS